MQHPTRTNSAPFGTTANPEVDTRIAALEDHLSREVRSSQALAARLKELETLGGLLAGLSSHIGIITAERDAAERKARDAIIERDEARKGRSTTIGQLDRQYSRMCDIVGASADETAEDAAKRCIAERDTAIKRKAEVLAELGETRALCHHHEKTASDAIKQRDAHAATIENLRRLIREADSEVAAPVVKARPQPGDVVPWAEVEDGALAADGDHEQGAQ